MAHRLLGSEMLSSIIDGSSIPSFVINFKHKVIYWNTAIEALSGISREKVIGTDEQWRAFYKDRRPTMADLIMDEAGDIEIYSYYSGGYEKSRLIEGAYWAEDFFKDLGGSGKWLHFTASPIKDKDGVIIGAIETLEDITERKLAENALYQSEKSFRSLFESAHDAIWVHDLEGNIRTANKATADLIGYPIEELLGMNVKTFIEGEKSIAKSREVKYRLIKEGRVESPYELNLVRKDGSHVAIMVSTNLVDVEGESTGFQNTARDVTYEKRMEENLRYYLQQITRAQEEERKRIARELHDDTAQELVSISRRIDNYLRECDECSLSQKTFLKDLQEQVNRGVQAIHRYAQDLRPSLIDDLGLVAALRSLIKRGQEYYGIDTNFEVIGDERRLPQEIELLLFRVIQEALNNIRKHAGVQETWMSIRYDSNRVEVTVNDKGRGFESSGTVDDLARDGKLGLIGMQERAKLLGGVLSIYSEPGKGTTVKITLPV